MKKQFVGCRVAISGATGGFGRAMCRGFESEGAELVLIDKELQALEEWRKQLGRRHETVVCDQGDLDAVEAAVARIGAVDVFVNNAGYMLRKPLIEMSSQEVKHLVDVNLTGAIAMAIGIGRAMVARGSGVIVNVASQLAFAGAAGRGIYGATKAGLVQFTRSAGSEWISNGVRVVAIAPGIANTDMTLNLRESPIEHANLLQRVPAARLIEADEVAQIVLFLASPLAASIVGQTLVADCGYLVH